MAVEDVDLADPLASVLFESSPDGIVIVDAAGTIVLANSQSHQMLGYLPGELVGVAVDELVPDQFRDTHSSDRDAYQTDPRPRPMGVGLELSALRKDGAEIPVEISLSPLQSEQGLLVIAAVRDVSDRLAAQAHSRRIQRSLDAISDAVFMFDPDRLVFTYVNQGALEQVGRSRSELLEMGPLDLMTDYDDATLRALIAPLVDHTIGSRSLTTYHQHRDGRLIPVEVVIQCPHLGRGMEPTVVALVRDISERLEIDRRLRAAGEEVQLLEDRERIARELHDTVIQRLFATGMTVQSMASRIADPELAARLASVVDDLDTTIRDIRTAIFGLQGGSFGHGLRARVIEVLRESRMTLGFEPRVHFAGPLDATVTDQVASHLLPTLREALANVARHAEAGEVHVTLSGTAQWVTLEVSDDGRGPDQQPNQPSGVLTGHGLANMTSRALELGGTCELRSGPGGGATLVWEVPVGSS